MDEPILQPGQEAPAVVANERPASTYGLMEAVGIQDRPDQPGHIFFVILKPSVSPEQEAAREEIEKVGTVLRVVFQKEHAEIFRDYFNRLIAIGRGVFTSTGFRPESLSDLVHLRTEIVQHAGGLIKSGYNKHLSKAVAKAMVLILVVAFVLQWLVTVSSMNQWGEKSYWMNFGSMVKWDHSVSLVHLGALLAASMVGLLFASIARNLDPTFETLMTPDADLMKPWVRLLFFGIAIAMIALIFQLQVVTVTFGDSFSTAKISEDLLTAILIGFLLGLAERALPSQVERWSKDLVNAARRSD